MTLKELIETQCCNEEKFIFCIYIKDLDHDLITTTKQLSFKDLLKIIGIFLANIEIEELKQVEDGIIFIKLKG